MSVDSGLPDFRGTSGFWRAYPALEKCEMRFQEIANLAKFTSAPKLAWGFYGHRLNLYRKTVPHKGFDSLARIGKTIPNGARVFTSNVDGQFHAAGYATEYVNECHGSIHYMQCLEACGNPVWSATDFLPIVDETTCTLLSELPTCPTCGGLARPNILMFADGNWDESRTKMQRSRLDAWLFRLNRPVVIEIGAGTATPTVRQFGADLGCPMIRINPTDATVGSRSNISISLGALDGITQIASALLR